LTTKEQGFTVVTKTDSTVSEFRRVTRIFFRRKLAVFGLFTILVFVVLAIFAPSIAPYDPYKVDVTQALLNPSWNHFLGTDALGRDTLSRIIYGSRNSLLIGVISVVIGGLIGQFLGLIAAYSGGLTSTIIMRVIDAQMSFPGILLMVIIAAVLGGGLRNVIIALSVSMIPVSCRLMYAEALAVKEEDYVIAARSIGADPLRIMVRHIYPNCFPSLLVLMTIQMGVVILSEAGLSYLGLGIAAPNASWGNMISQGYPYLLNDPVLSLAPGLAIMLVVFGFNMMGDGLRDALDPRLRGLL